MTVAVAAVASAGALYKSRHETERQRSLSVSRWGTFGQLYAIHRRADWSFHVKLAYEQSRAGSREHLWFGVVELSPGWIRGRLVNEPLDVPGLEPGSTSWQPLDRLTDWLVITADGRTYDPELAPVLLEEEATF